MGGYYARTTARRRGRRRDRGPLPAALRRRRAAAQPRSARRGRARRQARDAGRPVRHRPDAHRRQGPVRAAPPCAGRDPHADRARCRVARPALDAASTALPARRGGDAIAAPAAADARRCSTSSTIAWPAARASTATARRRSTRCSALRPQRWPTVAQRLAAVRAFAALPEARGAGRGQQARRQHPEEGDERGRAGGRRRAAAASRPKRRSTPRCDAVQPRADARVRERRLRRRRCSALAGAASRRSTRSSTRVMVNADDAGAARQPARRCSAALHAAMNRVADLSRLAG